MTLALTLALLAAACPAKDETRPAYRLEVAGGAPEAVLARVRDAATCADGFTTAEGRPPQRRLVVRLEAGVLELALWEPGAAAPLGRVARAVAAGAEEAPVDALVARLLRLRGPVAEAWTRGDPSLAALAAREPAWRHVAPPAEPPPPPPPPPPPRREPGDEWR